MILSENQRKIMRSALGLDNPKARKKSYRNRFFCNKGSDNCGEWDALCICGYAEKYRSDHPLTMFYLTLQGAEAVLKKGESLCTEDFPAAARKRS